MIKATDKKIGTYLNCDLQEKQWGSYTDIEGTIKARGKIFFNYNNGNIEYLILDKDYYLKKALVPETEKEEYWNFTIESFLTSHYYDVMTGEQFYEDVDCGGFIDYDGSIADIWVDGYISNLGLRHRGVCQGEFLVSGKDWLNICKNHEVFVNWANK